MENEVDVERTFTAFVRACGGEVLQDVFGPSPDFDNADYAFRNAGVVAELKRLVEDKSQDAAIKAKIQTLVHRWIDQRLIGPIYGTVRLESRKLPIQCQRELMAVFAAPVKARVRKANRQIRSSLEKLALNNGKGLLIVVNDGNYALETDVALYLISKALGYKCHSINSVIYLTVNMLSQSPLAAAPVLVWVHAARQDIVPAIDNRFVDTLFDAWRTYLGKTVGHQIGLVPLSTREAVSQIRLDPRRSAPWSRRRR